MPVLGMWKSAVDGLERQEFAALTGVLANVRLGVPALYNDGTRDWYIWQDSRISADDCSWLGALAANLSEIPNTWQPPHLWSLIIDIDTLRPEARNFLSAFRTPPTYEEDETLQDVLDLQGAPPAIAAAQTVPAGWTVVES